MVRRIVLGVVVGVALVLPAAPAAAADPPAPKAFAVWVQPATAVYSQEVRLTAAITPRGGGAPRGGTVTFRWDGVPIGTVTATTRNTTLVTTSLPPGTGPVTAEYSGDPTIAPSSRPGGDLTVARASTSTRVTAPVGPIPSGAAAEIRAVVLPVAPASASRRPTGAVTLTAGTREVTVPLNANGVAVWRPRLADGTHPVTATYGGSDLHLGSTAPPATVTVGAGDPVDGPDVVIPYQGGVNFVVGGAPGSVRSAAQQITAGRTGLLHRVLLGEVSTGRTGPGTVGDLRVSIQTLALDGRPSGTEIGAGTVPAPPLGSPTGRLEVVLTTPAPVTTGTRYAIVLTRGPEAAGVDGYLLVPANQDGDLYPGHTASERYEGASWTDHDHDLVLTTSVATSP